MCSIDVQVSLHLSVLPSIGLADFLFSNIYKGYLESTTDMFYFLNLMIDAWFANVNVICLHHLKTSFVSLAF